MIETVRGRDADYDGLAWFYDRYWSGHYHPWAAEVLRRTLLANLPAGSHILDVCCGNGVLARELSGRGYRVVGLDMSREMLAYASRNAPRAHFLCADARAFGFGERFEGALSTFDSLNHILSPADLRRVFENVRASLKPGAQFVFDVNLEGAYNTAWKNSCTSVDAEHACFIRGSYSSATRLAQTTITIFRDIGGWSRTDLTLNQRYYPAEQLLSLLQSAGFEEARCCDATADLGIAGPFSEGRGVVIARTKGKPQPFRGSGSNSAAQGLAYDAEACERVGLG